MNRRLWFAEASAIVPVASDPVPRRYRRVAALVCCVAICLRDRPTMSYRGLRSTIRWQRNPLATRSVALKDVRFLAHPPIGGCWSAEHGRAWRGGFDSGRRLGQRSPGVASQDPIPLAQADRPTRLRPARLPLDAFQKFARCARTEFVGSDAHVGANTIHFIGDVVSRVAGQVLLQRVAEKLAAGSFGPPSQLLRPLEDVVWNRYRGFHTKSMTIANNVVNRVFRGRYQETGRAKYRLALPERVEAGVENLSGASG